MNYKEIKKHNRKENKLYWASWDGDACDWIYKANFINLNKFVCEQATSDEGMTKNDKCRFHAQNPNGLVAQLPVYEDFKLIDQPSKINLSFFVYDQYENYHAKALRKYSYQRSGFTTRQVDSHIERLKVDIQKAKEVMVKRKLVGSLAA